MNKTTTIKKTSYQYGQVVQNQNAIYYQESKIKSNDNYGYVRMQKIKSLLESAVKWQSGKIENKLLVDIGCSVGGCTIEASKMGFNAHGVDFDPAAIELAKKINSEEKANAEFHQMDVSDWTATFPSIDIALAADIFEHLHDDELGSLLAGLKKGLTNNGVLVFFTVPGEYDYIFWRKKGGVSGIELPWSFIPFKWLSNDAFTRLTRIAALVFDIYSVFTRGLTYKERIKRADHPNPLTKSRLIDILERQGYEVISIATETMEIPCQMNLKHRNFFRTHEVTHRQIYGMATLRK
jgi:2-polyprenyl-3-methyl-5-hydroxy-6-metoxy-1,4-benzoquinol methylase